ncbi:MAG: replication initiation protein, partial [Bacteroidota bacterium]
MVKQDINLLEYPLWFQDECEAEKSEGGFIWRYSKKQADGTDKKEFVLKTSFKPPVKTDLIFLLYLLRESQNQSWKDEIHLTRYQVIKGCGLTMDARWYDRLEESLERWKQVSIEFNNAFYNGQEYETLHFGVVDSWGIHKETKKLRIRFSPEYLSMAQNTAYYKFLNFNQVKALRSPLATRLYQLLVKTFKNRDTWEIDAVLLAEKIPMKQKFPAHIVLKIKPAMNRIYKHTDLKVTVEERKKARGEIVLVFTKEAAKPKEKPLEKKTPPFVMPDNEDFKKLVSLLPLERQRQKSLLELVLRAFTKKGFDFVAWNIRYANKRAIGNYPAYFQKSLNGNFGAVMQEEEEVSQVAASKKTEEAKAKH